jgi:hypothetical protein
MFFGEDYHLLSADSGPGLFPGDDALVQHAVKGLTKGIDGPVDVSRAMHRRNQPHAAPVQVYAVLE